LASPTVGAPKSTLSINNVRLVGPIRLESAIGFGVIPGQEGGYVQYLGSLPERINLDLFLLSKSDFDLLKACRGIKCKVVIHLHGDDYISGNYFFDRLQYEFESGRSGSAAEKLNCLVRLIKVP